MKLKDTGLTAQQIKDLVDKYMIETYERFDFLAETAEGMYIYDENGTPYLDFYAGIAVNSAGNRNPKVVAAAKVYRHCAVCGVSEKIDEIKMVSAQAADELLGIEDVDASFVFYYESSDVVAYSARSMGRINVQIIISDYIISIIISTA